MGGKIDTRLFKASVSSRPKSSTAAIPRGAAGPVFNRMVSQVTPSRRLLPALALLTLLVTALPAPAQISYVRNASNPRVVTDPVNSNRRVIFDLASGGNVEVVPYAPDVVRVRFHWAGLYDKEDPAIDRAFSSWPTFPSIFTDDGNTYTIETSQLIVEIIKGPDFRVHFKSKQGYYLSRDDRMEYNPAYQAVADGSYATVIREGTQPWGFKLKAVRQAPPGEAYFGLGEYAAPSNRRGRIVQGWNSDTYFWQEFRNPMYMTLPMFYGVQPPTPGLHNGFTYGIFFNNPARPRFRMAEEYSDRYSFEAGDGQIDYFFFGGGSGHTMRAVIDRYSELTGRPVFVPKWSLGYQQSRYSYSNQEWVEWLAEEFRKRDYPLDAIFLDIDYMDTTPDGYYGDNSLHQLTFNRNFPDPAGMIEYCKARGVRLIPIMEPWLTQGDPKWSEANGLNHFVKRNDNSTLVVGDQFYANAASFIDITSTPAREWWKGKVLSFLNRFPFEAIWNDLNEPSDNGYIPLNAVYWLDGRYGGADGTADSRKWHLNEKNVFALRQTGLTYDILQTKHPNLRPYVLSRSGFTGVQKNAVGWSGDNLASWDHIRHNIGLGVSVMISGQANFGHDIGGFIGDNGGNLAELLTRWTEWGVLNPNARNHSQSGTLEREPWRFGEPFASAMRNSIKFRYRLMPYLYTLAWSSTQDGVPMNTPTVFHFPADANTFNRNDNDFMVGDFLLAAPVFTSGATTRTVYLPAGTEWFNWHSGVRYAGGANVTVSAPLGTLPLFVRSGSIIPMGPAQRYVDEFRPGYLELHNWPGADGSFQLYEDDGLTNEYLQGHFATTRLNSSKSGSVWTFRLGAREGSYQPGPRRFHVIAHDIGQVRSVQVDGAVVPGPFAWDTLTSSQSPGWAHDPSTRQLLVNLPDDGAERVLTVDYNSFRSNVGLVSVTGTFNNWVPDVENLRLVADHVWQGDIPLSNQTGFRFKFVANRNFVLNWGETNQGSRDLPITGIAESNQERANDIVINGTLNGTYRFRFNELTREYSVEVAANPDTDADGLPDDWELLYFGTIGGTLPGADADGDGTTNLQEYLLGTNPVDARDRFAAATSNYDGTEFTATFRTVAGKRYQAEFKNRANDGAWSPLGGVLTASGATLTITDAPGTESRFYRLRLVSE